VATVSASMSVSKLGSIWRDSVRQYAASIARLID